MCVCESCPPPNPRLRTTDFCGWQSWSVAVRCLGDKWLHPQAQKSRLRLRFQFGIRLDALMTRRHFISFSPHVVCFVCFLVQRKFLERVERAVYPFGMTWNVKLKLKKKNHQFPFVKLCHSHQRNRNVIGKINYPCRHSQGGTVVIVLILMSY